MRSLPRSYHPLSGMYAYQVFVVKAKGLMTPASDNNHHGKSSTFHAVRGVECGLHGAFRD